MSTEKTRLSIILATVGDMEMNKRWSDINFAFTIC